MEDVNNAVREPDPIGTCRTLQPTAGRTFLSSAPGTLPRVDHMFGHRVSPHILKREIIQSIFSDDNGTELEIRQRMKFGKSTITPKFYNSLLSSHWAKEAITRKSGNTLRCVKIKTKHTHTYWVQLRQRLAGTVAINMYVKKDFKSIISPSTFRK